MNSSSNAMSAKARSMYGNLLTKEDYDNLINLNSVSDIAHYLKTETHYRISLFNINESKIHRGELEDMIRNDVFKRFTRLVKFGSSNEDFYSYGILKAEIQQILAVVRAIKLNDKTNFIIKLPFYIQSHMSYDLKKLAAINSYAELLLFFSSSEYEKIIKQNFHDQEINYLGLEKDLNDYYASKVRNIIRKNKSKTNQKQFEDFFDTEMELGNIAKIYRLKKYFNSSPEEIKDSINLVFKGISQRKLFKMIDELNAEEFLKALEDTVYRKYFDANNFLYIEHSVKNIIYHISRRNINYATDSDLVLLSYMVVSDNEIDNIINIIECVKYKISKDSISNMLIM